MSRLIEIGKLFDDARSVFMHNAISHMLSLIQLAIG